jgi:hypothetical protein
MYTKKVKGEWKTTNCKRGIINPLMLWNLCSSRLDLSDFNAEENNGALNINNMFYKDASGKHIFLRLNLII